MSEQPRIRVGHIDLLDQHRVIMESGEGTLSMRGGLLALARPHLEMGGLHLLILGAIPHPNGMHLLLLQNGQLVSIAREAWLAFTAAWQHTPILCPHCGGTDLIDGPGIAHQRCRDCGADVSAGPFPTPDE